MLACQGCVQLGAPAQSAAPTAPLQVYETTAAPITNYPPAQVFAYYSVDEAAPLLAFEQPDFDTSPLVIDTEDEFSTTRLFSSNALTEVASDRKLDQLSAVPRDVRALGGEISFSALSARTGLAFDVGVTPRFEVLRDGNFERKRFGGEVRIGQNFDRRGEGEGTKSWYIFAGADGEALVWEPNGGQRSINELALRDKVIVGDMEAGLSFQRGPGQLSFSYFRREVSYSERNLSASEIEDFAGLTFSIKR